MAAGFVSLLGILLIRSTVIALACMFLFYCFSYAWMAPTSSVSQRVAPVLSRSLATGMQLMIGNIASLTLGPPLVGLLSDHFGAAYGAEGLRYALLSVSFVSLLGIGFYFSARAHLVRDCARAMDPRSA